MAAGDIGPVIKTGIFDATIGNTPSIVHVSGDVYAIAYQGPGADGWLRTITIDSAGNITILPHTLEFDGASGRLPRIIHVTGNIFAIAYWQSTLDDGIVRTVTISPAGVIGAVATLTFDAVRGRGPDIIHISGDVYAIAYNGAGDRGLLCTITIDNAGNIAFIATFTFDNVFTSGHAPHIIHIFGDVYAIAYTNNFDRGEIRTITIDNVGNIGAIASFIYDGGWSNDQRIIHVSGNVYAIAYTFFTGAINIGRVSTVTIDNAGNIGVAVINSFWFDAVQAIRPDIIHISGNIFGIAYRGPDDDGYLITLTISDDGTTIALTGSSLEFDDTAAEYPELIHIGDVYAIAYLGGLLGYVKTMDIQHISAPTVITDSATSVVYDSATPNGTLDDDGGEACDCGFEWGETIAYGNTTPTQSRTTGQTFSQIIGGLDPNKTYHFRAFATNVAGTSHGADRTFTTLATISSVTTNPAADVKETSATPNGTLDYDGGEACECRFQYGFTTDYGTNTDWQPGKETGDTFSQAIVELVGGNLYHFRAQAKNSAGTANGNDRTLATIIPFVAKRAYALSREEL